MFKEQSQEFVYVRTYSRWIDELSRRETWEETVERYMSFVERKFKGQIPDKVFAKMRQYILSLEVMPSMRALWTAGEALERDNTCGYNCAFAAIVDVECFSECLYILMNGVGYGFSVENQYVSQLPTIKQLTSQGNGVFAIPDNKAGWADSVKHLMHSLYDGKDMQFDYSLIRKKGAKLKTMGGRASGPEPLITLHNFIRDVFSKAQGRQLTSLECHDILNQIAEVVVVGGVRRSSEISLSDLNDELMRNAKTGNFPLRRYMANNSAVYYEKPSAVDFLKEWSALASSGSGERGISNLGVARKNAPSRRKGQLIQGFNPCVTGDTTILTKNGYAPIEELVDQSVDIWNGFEWSNVVPHITGENQEILSITFSDGRNLKCTPYHKFHIATDYAGGVKIIEAKDLQSGDKLIKHSFPIIKEGKHLKHAYTQGFVAAEGMELNRTLYVYPPKESCIKRLEGVKIIRDEVNNKRKRLVLEERPVSKNFVPLEYDLESKINWLAGLFDGDGTELKEGGLQLVSVNRQFLTELQTLLSTLGIQSKVVPGIKAGARLMPDGRGGSRYFDCQESYRICIGAIQMQTLKSLGLVCERMSFNKTPNRDASQFITVVDVTESGIADKVYCFNEPKRHLGIFNGVITGQCHEVALRSFQFCNLSEVVIRTDDDLDDLLSKVETATWIGILQSTLTDFKYLRKEWAENCNEERLLGVSLTGQMDNHPLMTPDNLTAMKKKALKIAQKASKTLGINMPAAVTLGKPSGSVSQLTNASSGCHVRYSPYYIRRYRISSTDPLLTMLKDQKIPMNPEVGQRKHEIKDWSEDKVKTWVLDFPIKSPDGAITRHNVDAIKQLEHYKLLQTYWCEHAQSCTIYVKDEEWFEVGNWVYQNWGIVNGISFLPYDGGIYELAPYEEITEKKYLELVGEFPIIDYAKLSQYEIEDNTEGAKSYACSGDVCELK